MILFQNIHPYIKDNAFAGYDKLRFMAGENAQFNYRTKNNPGKIVIEAERYYIYCISLDS